MLDCAWKLEGECGDFASSDKQAVSEKLKQRSQNSNGMEACHVLDKCISTSARGISERR